MSDYKTITRLFENDQDEIGFKLFKESNIIKLNNKNNNKLLIIIKLNLILNHYPQN